MCVCVCVAESNGKLPRLFILRKTAAWVPEFAVEDLPSSRTAVSIPEFAVNNLPTCPWTECSDVYDGNKQCKIDFE